MDRSGKYTFSPFKEVKKWIDENHINDKLNKKIHDDINNPNRIPF